MHLALQGATFHIEHIVPRSQDGPSELTNLAWACPGCNLRRSDRTEVTDPDTGTRVSFLNPRTDQWSDHFRFENYLVVGQTAVGRATVVALDLNHPRRVLIRQAEEMFELFPP